jgi:hypothetical protein
VTGPGFRADPAEARAASHLLTTELLPALREEKP